MNNHIRQSISDHVKNMGGGYLTWIDHGFPVHHPPHTSSTT
jgi:hypothetical protein